MATIQSQHHLKFDEEIFKITLEKPRLRARFIQTKFKP